jgi:hypothetical protein
MKKTSASLETDGEYRNEQERGPTNSDKAVNADDALAPVVLRNPEVCRPIDRLNPEDPAVIAALDVLRVKLMLSILEGKRRSKSDGLVARKCRSHDR